ncbi:MAG TPA: PQQ-binding-like beta-propeller repeat protein [Roseiarcus sp.]|nr:PQQ-binding-like beta-propeller repeat protein [Roseiarcus sp.]
MKRRGLLVAALAAVVIVAAGAAGGRALYRAYPVRVSLSVALARNYLRSWGAPPGATTTERNPAYTEPAAAAPALMTVAAPGAAGDDWPSYNRTLSSDRYAPLSEINAHTVGKLKVLCTYDTRQYTSFESGLIMVNGALIGTTLTDIFSIDPATCAENWRTREDMPPSILTAMRGAAYWDGMLFRGSPDGQVLAYDFETGKRIWRTTIADVRKGEFVAAAPIAWNGLVFIGDAGGDAKGGKGRMYALDAKSGKIVWEFFLVPRTEGDPARGPQGASPLDNSTWSNAPGFPISGGATWTSYTLDEKAGELYVPVGNPSPAYAISVREGEDLYTDSVVVLDAMTGAYKRHFKLVPRDWHDWDVASAPALIHTQGGKTLLSAAPKDGHLYGIDLAAGGLIYRTPVTRIENVDAPFASDKAVRFCPGATGGSEWNGPAYDPDTNLVITGEVDWCTTVKRQTDEQLMDAPAGASWFGNAMRNPFHLFGRQDQNFWGGWVYAVDADTGVPKWRVRSNYPIVGGVTPTAGGLVFVGDVGGNFYALDAASGEKLWGQKIGGGIGGGVIAYRADGGEKIAVTTGLTGVAWPTEVTTGKIVVLGLDSAAKPEASRDP